MTHHLTAFRTRLPSGGPSWLIDYDRSVLDLFRRMMPGPFTLHGYDTADLPDAAEHTHSIVYDHDVGTIKFSDGANWLSYSLSTHVHAASAITNTPAGNIAATNVQAALNELDTEKLAASSYTAADVLAKLLTVDGAGSGLDADLLDGNSSAHFLAASSYTAADVLAKILTVDGSGSGLDADLLDAQSGAFYLARGNHTGTQTAATISDFSTAADARVAAAVGVSVQAWDADLDTIAANNTAAGRAMVAAADAAAQRVLLRSGALVRKAADETAANYTTAPAVTWDQEAYDDASYHDNSTNPSRLTIPADGRYRVGANLALSLVNASVRVLLTITKGGVGTFDGAAAMESTTPGTNPRISVTTGPVACTAGEYFEVSLFVQTDTSITVLATSSNFWIEAC